MVPPAAVVLCISLWEIIKFLSFGLDLLSNLGTPQNFELFGLDTLSDPYRHPPNFEKMLTFPMDSLFGNPQSYGIQGWIS